MIVKKCLLGSLAALSAVFFIGTKTIAQQKKADYTKYYVSNSGNDNNPGTIAAPFRSIQKINRLNLKPHSIVYFKAGETFKGTLIIGADKAGAVGQWIGFSSYGNGKATLSADSGRSISICKSANVVVRKLKLTGLGRKTGNRENGLAIINSENVKVENLDISGFQKSGLLIDSSSSVYCDGVFVHDNGSAGITVEGRNSKKDSRNIKIFDCRAENNPGDPTKLDNHSGNGIVVGHCTYVTIEACTATNNGWDMPRIGNGPVGIWCYEADSVTIRYCLSYQNKTSKGGADGGGFDFDGGTTNSIIENCFSYGNQGSGYCIFQYWGASSWHDNIIRNNISENDGTVSDSQAGLYIWNSSDDPKQFYNCKVYGNIVYNSKVAAISFSDKSENGGFDFSHNVFVAKDSLIKGRDILGKCRFEGNDWWSLQSGFNAWGIKSFKAWAMKYQQEKKNRRLTGFNIDPKFNEPDLTRFTAVSQLHSFPGYQFSKSSALKKHFGGDLEPADFLNRGYQF
ncbi:right-handed parallel beta-helix repeat-containing protein [Mucilaginibacter sp.]|uniref:right-handed parallel beta-helix repeat-containing protein n=1 Tax=Mucilaginibacter sp. TaxID=1882438 RepID=UPI00283FC8DC|nr:right-handed parallel beta-helix repeat-containing protein [Mucilaginibacter sp.]MDR3694394.1 right-handed parallel beta-helix repeat-containing protein [Mucilaginibacter sp.]